MHLRDIRGMLKFSNKMTDRDYLVESARRFGVLDLWEAIMNSLD